MGHLAHKKCDKKCDKKSPIYEMTSLLYGFVIRVGINIGCYAYIRMTHEVLCDVDGYSFFLEVGAVSVPQIVQIEILCYGVFLDDGGMLAAAVQFDTLHLGTHLYIHVLLGGLPAALEGAVGHRCLTIGLREHIQTCPISAFKAAQKGFGDWDISYACIRLWCLLRLAVGFLGGSNVHGGVLHVYVAPLESAYLTGTKSTVQDAQEHIAGCVRPSIVQDRRVAELEEVLSLLRRQTAVLTLRGFWQL